MPVHSHSTRTASDGYSLHYQHWRPDGSPRGWVVMLPGIQSHSGWYTGSCRHLAEAGLDVRCVDRRGSGQNQIDRGHVVHWQRLVHDVRHFLVDVEAERLRYGVKGPITLIGISWGGKLALACASLFPGAFDRLLLVTPGLFPRIGNGLLEKTQLAVAGLLDIRERRVPIPLDDPSLFTSSPQGQEWIRRDPLALHEASVSFLRASVSLDRIVQRVPRLTIPVCLMLAGDDPIIDNEQTREFITQRAESVCRVLEYPAARHTLELEECRPEYFADLTDFALGAESRVSG